MFNIFGNKQKNIGERGEKLPLDNDGFPDLWIMCTV